MPANQAARRLLEAIEQRIESGSTRRIPKNTTRSRGSLRGAAVIDASRSIPLVDEAAGVDYWTVGFDPVDDPHYHLKED